MLDAADPGSDALGAHPESAVGDGAVFAEFQIPFEGLFRQSLIVDALEQQVVIADALRAAADFAVALGREQIHGLADLGSTGPRFHVKSLDRARVAVDEDGGIELAGDGRLVRRAKVNAPVEFEQFLLLGAGLFFAQFVDHFGRVVVGDARERGLDGFQLCQVAAEGQQLRLTVPQDALDDVDDHLLFHFHQPVEVAEGDLRFEHPELGQVAARLRFLRAEGGTEAVDFSERENVGFVVELTGLREVGFALVEVFGLEKGGGAFGGGGRENGRIHGDEAVVVQPLTRGGHDRGAHAQDRPLALHPNPQMAVVEREVHAVVFERHRIISLGGLHDSDLFHADFVSAGNAGGALIGADRPCDDHRRFLRQAHELIEDRLVEIAFERHALDETRPVAHQQEDQFALVGAVVDPALHGRFLAFVVRNFVNAYHCHSSSEGESREQRIESS